MQMTDFFILQGVVTSFHILPSSPDPEETAVPKPLATPSVPTAAGPAHGSPP